MRILLTLQAVLNYLYNNIIDLIWVKKVKFEDGSEQLTSNPKIYDIKLLSQAIADKGWAFMCKTTTQNLSKNVVPTLYNDISEKFNNQEKYLQNFTTVNNRVSWVNKIDDVYYASLANDNPPDYRTIIRSNNLDLSNPETLSIPLPTGDDIYNPTLQSLTTIEKIDDKFVLCYTQSGYVPGDKNRTHFLVCDQNFNVIQQFGCLKDYRCIRKVNNEIFFVTNEDSDHKSYKKFNLNDGITDVLNIARNSYGYLFEPNDISNDGKILTCTRISSGGTAYYDGIIILNDNNVLYKQFTFSTMRSSCYNRIYAAAAVETNYSYIKFYQISDDGETESLIGQYLIGVDSFTYLPYRIYKDGEKYIIPCSFGVITTKDFTNYVRKNYDITLTNNQSAGSYADGDDCFIWENSKYTYSGFYPQMYTDTYTIGGVNVDVNYYKYDDFKIAVSDNGGTNDANIRTVYNYLGYSKYFVIDFNNETIAVPRDKRSYATIFVGNNYQDTLSDLPVNSYTPEKLVSEIIEISDASVTLDILPNKNYRLTNAAITDITINSCEISNMETTIEFSTGNSAPTLIDNANLNWYDGALVLQANKEYTIVIFNGKVFYAEK